MVQGKPDAPITIVEYISVSCPCCQKFHTAVYPVLKRNFIDSGKARFVIREFPIDSLGAAGFMLARCGSNYFAVVDALFQRSNEWLVSQPLEPLFTIAKDHGVSHQMAERCLSDGTMLNKIQSVRDRAQAVVDHLPTLFVNGQKLEQMTASSPALKELAAVLEPYKGFGCGVTAERLPVGAQGFVDWCEKKGMETRDVAGASCGGEIDSFYYFGFAGSGGCPAIEKLNEETKTSDRDRRLWRPVVQWLRAHPDQLSKSADDAITDAIAALHGCKKGG
jgi:hypothetical protein